MGERKKGGRFFDPVPLSTGSVVIDYLIGGVRADGKRGPCPGLPRGRVTEVTGPEDSGKMALVLTAAAQTCRDGGEGGAPGTVAYVDWEHSVHLDHARRAGVPVDDPNRFRFIQPPTLDQGLGVIWAQVKAGVDLVIIDSVRAAIPEACFRRKSLGKLGGAALAAAKWSQYIPEMLARSSETGTTILGVSRQRKGPGAWAGKGPGEWKGPEAWKFYTSLRLNLQTEGSCGPWAKVRVKVEKCAVSPSQGTEAFVYITPGGGGGGIDNLRSVVDIATAHKIVSKDESGYTFQGVTGPLIEAPGIVEFMDLVKALPGSYEEIRDMAFAAVVSAGVPKPVEGNPLVPLLDILGEELGP